MQKKNPYSLQELFRIILPAVIAISLFVFSSFYLFLPQFEKSLLAEKKLLIRELVKTAWNMIDHINSEVLAGKYSLDEAKEIARHHLRNMKYGKESEEYFWINDFTPALIMHPYRPDLVGKDMTDFTDPDGTKLFMEFVTMVTEHEEGYVSYMWQWKDDQSRIIPKLSFVKEFEPWGWIIGTGIYLDEVRNEVALMSRRLAESSLIILFFVSIMAWFQVHQALKSLRMRQDAEAELLGYKDQLEIRVKNRTAELSAANRELQKALDEIKTLKGIIPICMHCRKIRDDEGSWSQLEKFISEHSEAQFSHGICEKCIREHYPETGSK